MNDKIPHLIMPMAGAGLRFSKKGFYLPKPLIEINQKPFFYWATRSVEKFINLKDITFIVLKEHIQNFKINKKILEYYPNSNIVVIDKVLNGAVLTCMEGIKQIDDECPIIFNDCDHMFLCNDFNKYCSKGIYDEVDGALLTFISNEPKFSYAQLSQKGNVEKTVEKKVVSDQAICGAYYFKNAKLFKESAEQYLQECKYKEFFMSGVYNVMINKRKKCYYF